MNMLSGPPKTYRSAAAPNPLDILESMHAGTIAAHAFDHRAHVFAAWLAMRQYGVVDGCRRFRAALRDFCVHLGASGKYHVTITEGLLRLIAAELAMEDDGSGHWQTAWYRFERRACYLLETSRAALAPYYSNTLLACDEARHYFLLPDRKPLPQTESSAPAMG